MSDGTYSAGTIFLQVVPVFKDLVKDITAQANKMDSALGDSMEKSGRKAGERASKAMNEELGKGVEKSGTEAGQRYSGAFNKELASGLSKVNKELGAIRISVEKNELRKDFAEIKAEAKQLEKDLRLNPNIDGAQAVAQMAALRAKLDGVAAKAVKQRVVADLGEARKGFDAFINHIERTKPQVKPELDLKQAERAMGAYESMMKRSAKRAADALGDSVSHEAKRIRAELNALGDMEIGIDIRDEDFTRKMLQIESALAVLAQEDVSVGVDADVLTALGAIEEVHRELDKLDRERTDVDVHLSGFAKVMAELRAIRSGEKSLSDDTVATANSFRAFSFIILGVASILPGIIPLIGALGGALLALGPALAGVGAGVGTMLLGFSGIQGAVQALMQHDKMAAKEAVTQAKTMRTAYRSVADAKRGLLRASQDAARSEADAARAVANAERTSAEQIKSALESRKQAEMALASAQRDATKAQEGLREARKLAQQDLQDEANKRAQNALDIRQGVIDVFNATVANNATLADGASTNLQKEQSDIALKQAQLRLKELRQEHDQLAAAKKKTDAQGVNGTDRVKQAQDQLTSALEQQKQAEIRLGQASAAVTKARLDGARSVADAVRNQNRTEQDNARSLSDAHRNLSRAQEDYQAALHKTGDIGATSMYNVRQAMLTLSPAGRKFARYLFGLRNQFYEIRSAAQEAMLPGVMDAIDMIVHKGGGRLKGFVTTMGTTLGNLFRDLGKVMTGPTMTHFFGMLEKLGPRFMRQFGKAGLAWMQVFARLMTIAAPWAVKLSDAMLAMSNAALRFVNSKRGTKMITDFLAYAAKVGPDVVAFVGNFVGALINLGRALAPMGDLVLGLVDGLLKFIAVLPPKVLAAIALAILGLVIAFQILNGAVALTMTILSLMEAGVAAGIISGVVIAVGAVMLLVGAFILAWTYSETFRNIVKAAIHAVGVAMKWVWEKLIKPAVDGIKDGFVAMGHGLKWVWDKIIHPVLSAFWNAGKFLWKIVGPILGFILKAWWTLAKGYQWVYKNILWPVIDLLIVAIAKLLWKGVIKPVFWLMGQAWSKFADGLHQIWVHVIKPVFDKFMDVVGNRMVDSFRNSIEDIKTLWSRLKDIMAEPVKFVIETVLNKWLIGGFNKIAKFVGSSPMKEIPVPNWTKNGGKPSPYNPGKGAIDMGAATGAVLPGYTPGRDVHTFVSPTGGRLRLSGGEAVMRPEWTQAVGPDFVHRMNRLARFGGKAAVARAMYGEKAYAKGGIFWPVPGHQTSTYRGHDGVDINRGSGWDDYGDPIRAFRPGRIVYVGAGHGYGNAIFEKVDGGPTVVYGHTSRQVARAGQHVAGGQLIGFVGNSGNSSAPHLHFGIPGGTYDQAAALLSGANVGGAGVWDKIGGFFSGVAGWAKKALGAPLEWLKGRVSGAFDKLDNNPFGHMLVGLGKQAMHGLADMLKGAVGDVNGDVSVGAGVKGYAGIVKRALNLLHQPTSLVDEVLHRMAQESGGNPNAVNNWDVNASNGTPSVGLMQVIGPTFRKYAGQFANVGPFKYGVSTNPLANIFAGLNYALHRYGNIADPMLQAGGYADGGIIGGEASDGGPVANNGTMMYDNGGYLPPGLTTVLNLTGKPEPVFTSEQWGNLQGTGGQGGAGIHYEPHFEGSDLTANDVADDLLFAFGRLKNRGKYAGTGV